MGWRNQPWIFWIGRGMCGVMRLLRVLVVGLGLLGVVRAEDDGSLMILNEDLIGGWQSGD